MPMRLCSLCIYCGEDAPPATTLTGDAPSRHLMCPIQSTGRRRQGHPAGGAPAGSAGKQCARAGRHAILTFSSARSFTCTPRIRRSRATGHKKIASATDIRGSKLYILYVPGPTCWGPVLLCMPPFAIKGEAYDVTKEALRPSFRQKLISSYKLPSNTSHSGVGYYAPAARTTLNPRVLSCVDPPASWQAKRLGPSSL
jgi:hypothetical protein